MRTRFLSVDYFKSTPSNSFETLTFLNLPVPHLSAPHLSTIEDLIRCDSILDVNLQFENLAIESAVSKFLSGVVPFKIDAEFTDLQADFVSPNGKCQSSFSFDPESLQNISSVQESEILHEEEELGDQKKLGLENGFGFKNNGKILSNIGVSPLHFETPELETFSENFIPFEEEILLLSEVADSDNAKGKDMPKLFVEHPVEVLESIFSVGHVASEYLMKVSTQLDDSNCSLDSLRLYQSSFPIIELNEESLSTCFSLPEELASHLQNLRPQDLDENYDAVNEGKGPLGSMEKKMLELLLDFPGSKQIFQSEPPDGDVFVIEESIIMLASPTACDNSDQQEPLNTEHTVTADPITFEELQFLEEDSFLLVEVIFDTQTLHDPETSDCMFTKESNFRNYDEMIISPELTLTDDIFKSLPVPIFHDHDKTSSLYMVLEEILDEEMPLPLSASDAIYLNWDLLEQDKCNPQIGLFFQKLWAKIDSSSIYFGEELPDDETFVYNLAFSDDSLNMYNTKRNEELHMVLPDSIYLVDDPLVSDGSVKLLHDGDTEQGEHISERKAEKPSQLHNSMSDYNCLDYFLNPQKATAKRNSSSATKSIDSDVKVPPSTESSVKHNSYIVPCYTWHVVSYQVQLSETIVALDESFEKSYLFILESEIDLRQIHPTFPLLDSHGMMSLPKQKLLECYRNGKNMAFIALCAIKQAAWYMSYYGLHPACQYLDKLSLNLDYFRTRLNSIYSSIKEACQKIDRERSTTHPALTVIHNILQSQKKSFSSKVLIVAEKVFWCSLKNLLLSMGLSFNELRDSHSNFGNVSGSVECTYTRTNDLLLSDCLLVSRELVSGSFPFDRFGIILEYGGPNHSSKISNLSFNLKEQPHLHFLKVELDGSRALKALCAGVEMPKCSDMSMVGPSSVHDKQNDTVPFTQFLMEEEACLDDVYKNKNDHKLEELLNFSPIENICGQKEADDVQVFPTPSSSSAGQSEDNQKSMGSCPEAIIIVNTQDVEKEMIISRRSTYQAILAMERKGTQVVERDSYLPVDIILSPAICLVWYASGNIGKKGTTSNEAASCLPFIIDNIATNVLTSLSFAFSGCFLIFEGDLNFLFSVMDFSDGLFAAAASLGINLQLFFSYSSDFTNEIIMNSIKYATESMRISYPRMPESVTLAESFLTELPSMNNLTAHAILSSGNMLNEFMEWSNERKILVLKKYDIYDESIFLFTAFCKYGEREDSKSVMTDCSSSVSSGPDSDGNLCKIDSQRKRRKQAGSPQNVEIYLKDLLQFEPTGKLIDGILDSCPKSKSYNPKIPEGHLSSGSLRMGSLFEGNSFGQEEGSEIGMMRNTSGASRSSFDRWNFKPPHKPNELKTSSFLHDNLLPQSCMLDPTFMEKSFDHYNSKCQTPPGKVSGEVIDLTDSPLADKDFSFVADTTNISNFSSGDEKYLSKKCKIVRSLFDDSGHHSASQVAAEFQTSSDIFDLGNTAHGKDGTYSRKEFERDPFPEFPLNFDINDTQDKGSAHRRYKENSQDFPFQGNITTLRETPLSCALRSANRSHGTPWTIEFLNRIKEKTRLRQQQSLSGETSNDCFGYSGNISNLAKKRTPPIIESFKYKSDGNTGKNKLTEQKTQKRSRQSSNLMKKGKSSTSMQPTWTPADKRASQTLTFEPNKNGGQAKLVWSDRTDHMSKKSRFCL